MSYVRWSSKVRKNCTKCGDTGRVPMAPGDDYYALLRGSRPCATCSSCWYVYWNVGDFIAIHHACSSDDDVNLAFEDALEWEPPQDCPMRDVALEAVREAHSDWKGSEVPR